MANFLHTQGSWYHVDGHDARKAPYIRAVGDALPGTLAIAQVCGRGSITEQRANGRLIANSPRMIRTLARAAHVLAELQEHHQTAEVLALRRDLVDTIRAAAPEYYGEEA